MDTEAWKKVNCVSVPQEDWRAHRSNVLAYINANPEKIYLLPDAQYFFDDEISGRIAQEIEFPSPVRLISSAGEFKVKSLSAVLNAIPYDEFAPTGKNFLILPQKFFDISAAIKRQCSILRVPIEICLEEEFSALAAEQKLIDNAQNLLRELDGVKTLCARKNELRLKENISCVEEFLAATHQLEEFLKSSNEAIRLVIAGDTAEGEHLSEILQRLNFEVETCGDSEVAEKLSNCAACVFAASALNDDSTRFENFFNAVAESPNKNKIVFAVMRPALREENAATNPMRVLATVSKILDNRGFNATPIFFLDAADVFYHPDVAKFLEETDSAVEPDDLINVLKITGREEYFLENSLRNFFEELPRPSIKALLQKTGLPHFENYLRRLLRKNPTVTENLLCQFERAISFLEGDRLKKLRLQQIKKLSVAVRQAEIFREKILLIAMQEKTVGGKEIVKSLLYDVDDAIEKFIAALETVIRETLDEFTASEEFCAKKLSLLCDGEISNELETLIDDTENKLRGEYDKRASALLDVTKKFLNGHQVAAKKFIDFVCATAEKFSAVLNRGATLPATNIFDVPAFDLGISANFSSEPLSELVKHCTKILCTQEIGRDDYFDEEKSKRYVKKFYLSGTFRKELRRRLDESIQNKMDALKKNLKQKFFDATRKYFAETARICQTQREACLNAFCQQTKDVYNRLDSLEKDFANMEEVRSALKNFYENWRVLFPKQSQQVFATENFSDELLNEILERRNLLSDVPLDNDATNNSPPEPFSQTEKPAPKSTADEEFSLGKKEFRYRHYENAFKNFSRAAAMGHINSIQYLAHMHQNGLGVPQNIYSAIENWLDAFCLGDNDSASELRDIFCDDLKFYSKALEWNEIYLWNKKN